MKTCIIVYLATAAAALVLTRADANATVNGTRLKALGLAVGVGLITWFTPQTSSLMSVLLLLGYVVWVVALAAWSIERWGAKSASFLGNMLLIFGLALASLIVAAAPLYFML